MTENRTQTAGKPPANRRAGVGTATPRPTYLPFGQPHFGDEEIEAVARVLRSGWVGMGPETLRFEEELAAACGAAHVVTVNSCTSALFLSLLVHGVKPGDEVVVPSFTWISTANAARHLGATPVFCDIDPVTLCATPDTVRACLTPRTKAVVVVHLGGLAVNVAAIREVVPSHIAIIEDAAHAWGSRGADGTPVGASGNLSCFSFYANKNLSTGDGGAVALNHPLVAERLRSLRQHALPTDAWRRFIDAQVIGGSPVAELGYKMNYTDLQSAIGRVQLRRQAEFARRRLAVAQIYSAMIAALPYPVSIQEGVTREGHARHLFLIQLPLEWLGGSRHDVLGDLRRLNIGASIHYHPVHRMPLYRGARPASLPVTDHVAERILTLPISASMSEDDARQVGLALALVLERRTRTGLQRQG